MTDLEDVKKNLTLLLADEQSLRDFRIWLSTIAWNLNTSDKSDAAVLVRESVLFCDEFDYNHWTVASLKTQLLNLLEDCEKRKGVFEK